MPRGPFAAPPAGAATATGAAMATGAAPSIAIAGGGAVLGAQGFGRFITLGAQGTTEFTHPALAASAALRSSSAAMTAARSAAARRSASAATDALRSSSAASTRSTAARRSASAATRSASAAMRSTSAAEARSSATRRSASAAMSAATRSASAAMRATSAAAARSSAARRSASAATRSASAAMRSTTAAAAVARPAAARCSAAAASAGCNGGVAGDTAREQGTMSWGDSDSTVWSQALCGARTGEPDARTGDANSSSCSSASTSSEWNVRGEGVTPVWRKAGGAAGCDAGVASRVADGSLVVDSGGQAVRGMMAGGGEASASAASAGVGKGLTGSSRLSMQHACLHCLPWPFGLHPPTLVMWPQGLAESNLGIPGLPSTPSRRRRAKAAACTKRGVRASMRCLGPGGVPSRFSSLCCFLFL